MPDDAELVRPGPGDDPVTIEDPKDRRVPPRYATVARRAEAARDPEGWPAVDVPATVMTTVIVQDPADSEELFAVARGVAGLPDDHDWYRLSDDAVHMLQTDQVPGAARVTVHFHPGGGAYPGDQETGEPDGYVLVTFDTTGTDPEPIRAHH